MINNRCDDLHRINRSRGICKCLAINNWCILKPWFKDKRELIFSYEILGFTKNFIKRRLINRLSFLT